MVEASKRKPVGRFFSLLSSWLTVLVPLSPVVVAWTYLLGRFYSETYFNGLGVNVEFLRPDTTTVLMLGAIWQLGAVGVFLVMVVALAAMFVVLAVAMIALAFTTAGAIHLGRRALGRTDSGFRVLFRKSAAAVSPGVDENQVASFSDFWRENKFQIVLGFTALAGISLMTVSDIANDQAGNDVRKWLGTPEDMRQEFSLQTVEGVRKVRGHLVTCGEDACAIWTPAELIQIHRSSLLMISGPSRDVGETIVSE